MLVSLLLMHLTVSSRSSAFCQCLESCALYKPDWTCPKKAESAVSLFKVTEAGCSALAAILAWRASAAIAARWNSLLDLDTWPCRQLWSFSWTDNSVAYSATDGSTESECMTQSLREPRQWVLISATLTSSWCVCIGSQACYCASTRWKARHNKAQPASMTRSLDDILLTAPKCLTPSLAR